MTDPAPLSVLIVDDDEATRRSLRRVLRLDGYYVEMVGSAAELRTLDSLDNFFAVLLDRKLPDADGSDLLEELKTRAPHAAILIVTGYADIDSTILAIRTGVHDYLIKPVEPETLRNRLNSLAEIYSVRQALQRSERRMLFLVENLPAGAIYLDGQRLFGNKTLERMTGYAANEIATIEQWFAILCQGQAGQCAEIYHQNRAANFSSAFRFPIVRKDGRHRCLEIAGYRYDPHEIWLVTDITELQETQQRLVQSERLAAIGQVVAGLAHESRNALQRARACLDLLELDLPGQTDQTDQLDLIQRIRRSLNDLHHNYEEVRSYAAPITLSYGDHQLADLLRLPFDDLQCEFKEHTHQLRIDDRTDGAKLRVDAHRIRQLFRNIFENAIAASQGDCRIDVALSTVEIDGRLWHRAKVRDYGSGMGPVSLSRLFEPFFTTKTSGTGLGMAICKRIVDAHDGRIFVDNAHDGGAIVHIELPHLPNKLPSHDEPI